jgi:nucleotide-binding universal stress UspA family protein
MYERLLVAVDNSEMADEVLAAAQELAQLAQAEVWVLHVRERESLGRAGLVDIETADEAQELVDGAVQELTRAGVKASGEIRHALYGYAAREIVQSAAEHDAGTIVMGSKGRGDLAGLVLGSTAHKVLHLTDRPVLIAR